MTNWNKDINVQREASSLMLIQYDGNRKNTREEAVDELLETYKLLQLTLRLLHWGRLNVEMCNRRL